MKKVLFALLLILALLISGCGIQDSGSVPAHTAATAGTESTEITAASTPEDTSASGLTQEAAEIPSELFSSRDLDAGYDESKSALIRLNGTSAVCSSDAVKISGSTVTITDEGTYILSGSLDDGMVIIDAEKTDKTQLVLDGVTIRSETSAPIYVRQADKVFLTLAPGSTNSLSNGGTFTAIDENNIDAVIFSKDDLTLNGSGILIVTSPAGHGIVSKDSLKITGGIYDINCASHGLAGKDDVCIVNAEFTIISGKDGIHGENTDDASLGFVYIQSGSLDISAEGDGISASACLQIKDGSFRILSGGGSVNGTAPSSGSWGSFMGGGRHEGGKMGGGMMGSAPDQSSEAEDTADSTSMKGVKAGAALTINGGVFTIDAADDAVHSNDCVTVSGGTFEIASGDDGFHADVTLTVTGGTIRITGSYEGLEGQHVVISGGDITLTASDDGVNAAGGTDLSGQGGRDGMFGGPGMGSSSNGSITISGGTLQITSYGDGIDANGSLEITGGNIIVSGPSQGDTSTLDYDTSAVISGGTFIGTGASGMAQTFSSSEQGVIAVSTGEQSAGTQITLTDKAGNTLLTCTPALSFAVVILSSPEMIRGETYVITVGTLSGEFTAS